MVTARIGEIAVSGNPAEELVAFGLGSCVGVVMTDARAGIAGLAHVMLPSSGSGSEEIGKYADTAVPELLARMIALGAVRGRLRVAIAGGAAMFGAGRGMDVGSRNVTAVTAALAAAGLRCHAADTGGEKGRTVRVSVAGGGASTRQAGGATSPLLPEQLARAA